MTSDTDRKAEQVRLENVAIVAITKAMATEEKAVLKAVYLRLGARPRAVVGLRSRVAKRDAAEAEGGAYVESRAREVAHD